MHRWAVIVMLALSVLSVRLAGAGDMYAQGRTHFSLVGGNGTAFNNTYFVIGASVSHYFSDGLSAGLSYEHWSGGDPAITKYAPSVQYVFDRSPAMRPYVGGFYRHTEVDGLPSIDSIGGRVGMHIASGGNAYVSAGLVYESYLDCRESVYRACSETYPDFAFTVGF